MFRISLREERLRSVLIVVGFAVIIAAGLAYILWPKEPPVYPVRTITVPEGLNSYQIDKLLFENGIISKEGTFASLKSNKFNDYWFVKKTGTLEGFLFPDTYEFYENSSPEVVARKFLENWNKKASIFFISKDSVLEQITAASLVEKEIPDDEEDRAIVAGIIFKRVKEGIPLQIDATLCYIKNKLGCDEVVPSDKEIDSSYNTYKNKGLPPGPISNPGLSAIKATLFPEASDYWYFISDPKTGRTVFAKTLDEHIQNIVKYLR
ncbi:MAG: endolytic transglycosylase MltG [Parcubacteria group bacterium]